MQQQQQQEAIAQQHADAIMGNDFAANDMYFNDIVWLKISSPLSTSVATILIFPEGVLIVAFLGHTFTCAGPQIVRLVLMTCAFELQGEANGALRARASPPAGCGFGDGAEPRRITLPTPHYLIRRVWRPSGHREPQRKTTAALYAGRCAALR